MPAAACLEFMNSTSKASTKPKRAMKGKMLIAAVVAIALVAVGGGYVLLSRNGSTGTGDNGGTGGTGGTGVGGAGAGPAIVNLLSAGDFVLLAKTGASTTGTTHVTGDLGVSPAAASYITGFGLIKDASNTFSTSSLVTGHVYASDYTAPTPVKMTTAINDMMTAYNDAAGRTSPTATELGAGDITSKTLAPGLYKWSSNLLISASGVTLSGGANDTWIFQVAGNLNLANGAHVYLSGGAVASHIFWQVAGKATLGTTSVMNGIILCKTAIVLNTGATLNGMALAQTAITLSSSVVKT